MAARSLRVPAAEVSISYPERHGARLELGESWARPPFRAAWRAARRRRLYHDVLGRRGGYALRIVVGMGPAHAPPVRLSGSRGIPSKSRLASASVSAASISDESTGLSSFRRSRTLIARLAPRSAAASTAREPHSRPGPYGLRGRKRSGNRTFSLCTYQGSVHRYFVTRLGDRRAESPALSNLAR
jgi:hypothetical protein